MAVSHTATRPSFSGVMRQIHATSGMRGFFAGLSPCILRAFPANACAMWAYEGLMRTFGAEQVHLLVTVLLLQLNLLFRQDTEYRYEGTAAISF